MDALKSSGDGSALPGWGRQGRAPEERLTSSSSWPPSSSSPFCHPPPAPARPAVGSVFRDSTGSLREVSRGKYTMQGVADTDGAISRGLAPAPRTRLVRLAHRRGPAVLAASDEFLVERH